MNVNIKNGNAALELKELPDESVDCLISDPPYGISFMNKDWDKAIPSIEIWNECLRVLKSGAFAFIMCSPRSDVQAEMIIKLKEAGFDVGFSPIYWTYASGFPKAMNISKAVDRKLNVEQETREFENPLRKNRSYNVPTGFSSLENRKGNGKYQMGVATSEEAKRLNGSYAGFQMKPSVEVIIVAMKPLSEKTYVEQALKNGKGITWLDDGRIPYQSESDKEIANSLGDSFSGKSFDTGRYHFNVGNSFVRNEYEPNGEGRFPANLLVENNVLDMGLKTSKGHNPNLKTTGYGKFGGGSSERVDYKEDTYIDDAGDFSRYFSLDAWYSKNIEELPDYVQRIFPFLYVPKATSGERNEDLENLTDGIHGHGNLGNSKGLERFNSTAKNIHPTVKPVKLMTYLVTIGSRQGDTILDPFMGSGTTGVACRLLNRDFIGYEIEGKYFEIAEKRINSKPNQLTIEDFTDDKIPQIKEAKQ